MEDHSISDLDPETSRVSIRLSLTGLDISRLDLNQQIICDIWIKTFKDWEIVGHTEPKNIQSDLIFLSQFVINYIFTARQLVKLQIRYESVDDMCYFGCTTFYLSDIVRSNLNVPLNGIQGTFQIFGSFIEDVGDILHVSLMMKNIKIKKSSGTKAYFLIKKVYNDNEVVIYRGDQVSLHRSMKWKEFAIPIKGLLASVDCSSLLLSLMLTTHQNPVIDFPIETPHLKQLEGLEIHSTNPNDSKKQPSLIFKSVRIEKKPTFLQIIRSGLELNVWVAIDFTQSNGDPHQPNSLHSLDGESVYTRTIRSVCGVLETYDTDGMLPSYGFGGVLNGKVYHAFQLDPEHEEVHGVDKLIDAYRNSLKEYTLYGPTYYAPIIKKCVSAIKNAPPNLYTILLLLTDGIFNDMQETIDAIVDGSFLAISIIIVGIGDADFRDMIILDADETPLISSDGIKMHRDIVQFVPYNKYEGTSKSELSMAVLEELPRQVLEWAQMVDFKITA